jgi:membrane associated rhomboid family serine protease
MIGGAAGVIFGLLAAYFYARASEENLLDHPPRIKTMDAIKLGVALLALVRQITDLGNDGGKK